MIRTLRPLCSLIGLVLLLPSVALEAEDTIKIAFIAPLSGPFALIFEENLKNFRAAADLVSTRGGSWAARS